MVESSHRTIWWLPTVGLFLFLGMELWVFIVPGRFFGDPGVGRHLRTAEFILKTGRIPQTDPLTFTRTGEPWLDFEWAFEATLGELYRAGGLGLIAAFCSGLFATTILVIYRTLLQSGFSLSVVMLYTYLAFSTLHLHFAARPVLFTYLFMALVVEVWCRRTRPLLRDWIILPIVFLAWANLHAGWAAALAFLLASLLGRLIDRSKGLVSREEAPVSSWLGLTLLCALMTFLNPWGWDLHRHVYLLATSYKSFALWEEYAPPNFASFSMAALAVTFLLGILLFARVNGGAPLWRWQEALPFLFFLYEGLKAQRHVLLLVEVAVVPIARDLEALLTGPWWPRLSERFRLFQANQRRAGGDAWMALVIAILTALILPHLPTARHIAVGDGIEPGLLNFLHDHPDRFHRPLTMTSNAGPLLWNMRPDFRVSFDDRGDFYGDPAVYAFVAMTNGSHGWQTEFAKGNYDSVLLDPYLQLNDLLHGLPGWREVYRDPRVVVYWKDPPSS